MGGDLTATVRASAGGIGDILVEDDIDINPGGSSSIRSKDGANRIICDTISSQTVIGLVADDGPGVLGLLHITEGGIPSGCIVNCKSLPRDPTNDPFDLEHGIKVTGDMGGIIYVHEGGAVDAPIWIEGSLTSTGRIGYEDPVGLTNQVIINRSDMSETWDGEVIVDYDHANPSNGVHLSPEPYYAGASSLYGGGAVGLATFHLYDDDCQPENGGSLAFGSPTTAVVLSMYGPVVWDEENFPDAPVTVSYSLDNGAHWTPLPHTDFSVTVIGRFIAVTALTEWDFSDDFDYRIESIPDALLSDIPSLPPIHDFTYIIHSL